MGCGSSKPNVVVAEGARFYTSRIKPPTGGFEFSASLSAMHRGEEPSAHARASYLEYWAGNPEPWRWGCREGTPPVEDADAIAREEAAKMKAESDDAGSLSAGTHGTGVPHTLEPALPHRIVMRAFGGTTQTGAAGKLSPFVSGARGSRQ